MNRKPFLDILEFAATDSLSRNTNLWPKILERVEKKPFMMSLRTRPILAVLIAVIILAVLSGAAYALGRVFGYIPGIGLVDKSTPIRVLAEPVSMEQQGVSVTVSKVIADSTRTLIFYRVNGIPLVEKAIPACVNLPMIRLTDGSMLENIGGGDGIPVMRNGNTMFFDAEYIYSPIPVGVKKVIFVLSCRLPQATNPVTWEVMLNLIPAPADFATPAVEIGATYSASSPKVDVTPTRSSDMSTETSTPKIIDPAFTPTPKNGAEGSGLSLEKVLELSDSYILIGKFTDGGDLNGPLYISTSSDTDYLAHIEDAKGNLVAFKVREDVRPDPVWDVAYYWAYEISKPITGPLKITVDRIRTRKHNTAQIQLETGDHPQASQKWDLNLPVKLGESDFVVDSVTFLGNGYRFDLTSENLPEGVTPDIEILDSSSNSFQFDGNNSSEDHVGKKTLYTITLTTKERPPTGKLSIIWGLDEFTPQKGPWSLIWTPSIENP